MRKSILLTLFFCITGILSFSQKKKEKDIEEIVNEWAVANNEHSLEKLEKLYTPIVIFYAKTKDVSTCLKEKKAFFDKYNDYSISINHIDIDFYKNGSIKCNFNKNETWNGTAQNSQQGYLILEQRGNEFFISGESDSKNDSKLNYTPLLGDKIELKSSLFNILLGVLIGLVLIAVVFFFKKRKQKRHTTSLFAIPLNPAISNEAASIPTFSNEALKTDKGLVFEEYVVQKFEKKYFRLLNWRSDKHIAGHYPLSNMDPDIEFLFKYGSTQASFAIECKWRNNYFNNAIDWAKEYQLENYRKYQKKAGHPVFVVLGVGGLPSQPTDVYIIPLNEINDCVLNKKKLARYYRHKKGNFFLEISSMKLQ